LLGTSKGTELVRFAAAARRRRRSKTNDRPAVIENTKGEGERERERSFNARLLWSGGWG
jgi:hypothetical protein